MPPLRACCSRHRWSKAFTACPRAGRQGSCSLHRGALFLALVVAAAVAAFNPAARPVGVAVMAISVVGFLAVYARAGMPTGALRTIALVDLAALVPLAFVALHAWRG